MNLELLKEFIREIALEESNKSKKKTLPDYF